MRSVRPSDLGARGWRVSGFWCSGFEVQDPQVDKL